MTITHIQWLCQAPSSPQRQASSTRLSSQTWARSVRRWALRSNDKLRQVLLLTQVSVLKCTSGLKYLSKEHRLVKDVLSVAYTRLTQQADSQVRVIEAINNQERRSQRHNLLIQWLRIQLHPRASSTSHLR